MTVWQAVTAVAPGDVVASAGMSYFAISSARSTKEDAMDVSRLISESCAMQNLYPARALNSCVAKLANSNRRIVARATSEHGNSGDTV